MRTMRSERDTYHQKDQRHCPVSAKPREPKISRTSQNSCSVHKIIQQRHSFNINTKPPNHKEIEPKMTLPSKQSKRNSSNRLRQSKQVRFCPQVVARRALSLSNYTNDEMKACWYTADEYSRIRRGVMKTVDWIELEDSTAQHLCEGDDDFCTRGLECRTSQGAKLRLHNRLCAFDAVFREQDLQFREYRYDDNEIASSYMIATLPSKAQAYMMGLSDQNQIVCCSAASHSSPSSWPLSTSFGSVMMSSSNSCNNNSVVLPPLFVMNSRLSSSPPAWAA